METFEYALSFALENSNSSLQFETVCLFKFRKWNLDRLNLDIRIKLFFDIDLLMHLTELITTKTIIGNY